MYLNALRSQRIPDTVGHVVPDLPAKSISHDSSIANHLVTEQNQSPLEVTKRTSEANNSRQSPVEAKTILIKSPITVLNTDLRIAYFCYTVIAWQGEYVE